MSRIAHYVMLACPHCAQKHVRAEFASVSDPVFSHALDPPSRERVCRGCGKSVKLDEFHRVEKLSTPRINDVVRGRRGVSADTAMRLARYFGGDARSWLNLQAAYDLQITQLAVGERIEREVTPASA